MKYIKVFESIIGSKGTTPYEIKIGDSVICIAPDFSDDILEEGKTYIVTDMKDTSNKYLAQVQIKGLDYWWDLDRFLSRDLMTPEMVSYYDDMITKKEAEKYNL